MLKKKTQVQNFLFENQMQTVFQNYLAGSNSIHQKQFTGNQNLTL